MENERRPPPPSWIDRDFIESALKNEGQKRFAVDSVTVQYANAEGAGYGSLMFRVTAFLKYEDNDEPQRETLIVKTALQSGVLKDVIGSNEFKIEGQMLHDVMPQVHEQLASLEGEAFRPLAAKCYQRGEQPASYLVMEDLKASGFRSAQAGQPLDLKHCAVVLRAYARLHASSAYLLSKKPQYKDTFAVHMFANETFVKWQKPNTTTYLSAVADSLSKTPGFEEFSERYKIFAERCIDVVSERMKQIKEQTKLQVLSHSDCWKGNMMFKYVDEEVSEVRLVDFQYSSMTTPASDLSCFLYANAKEEVHRQHMDDLLSEYHSTLVGLLRRLGMEQEAAVYTLEELKKDMDHCSPMAAMYGFMSSIALATEKYGPEFAKAINDRKLWAEVVAKSLNNPYSLSYMKYLTPIFINKGIL